MPIFLKYGDIKGDVTEDAHRGWIELTNLSFGVSRGTGRSGSEGSAPSMSDLLVTKGQDSASPALNREAVSGRPVDAVIDLVRDDSSVSLRYTMSNTMISSWSVSGGGDSGPVTESMGLNFTKIEFEQNPGTPPP